MATVFLVLARQFDQGIGLTCSYALSAFETPPENELPSPISEPVVGDLSGWSSDLQKPPCAVIGLGFEPGRALGCIDYLEIPEIRLFAPIGTDERFKLAVAKANEILIAESGADNLLSYSLIEPYDTYQRLESLIHGLLPNYRPVIIPLGPKMFAALSMIIAIHNYPRICVWRTSAGSGLEVSDRRASGEVAMFSIRLNAPPSFFDEEILA